jgi:PIN domain nuclease of toxin-antitoxin system
MTKTTKQPLLDTHIWVWWVHGDSALPESIRATVDAAEETGILVSAISCWEIAKLVERGRLTLPCPPFDWLQKGLSYPGVRLIELSPRISVESTCPAHFTATRQIRSLWPRHAFWMCRW